MPTQDDPTLAQELTQLYPALDGLDSARLERTLSQAQVVRLPAGTPLFGEGAPCRQFPFVLEGAIRVAKLGDGRELQLYRVTPGESCVLTSSCLVGRRDYPATGVVEQDVRLVVLPLPLFDELMATHAPFRQYVFSLFAERLTELMSLVEAVAFHRLDRRVAGALLGKGRVVHATHQQLADELGSVREIVTRVLRSYSDQGLVRLGRGSIEVLDAAGLRRIADGG
ncbi:MAG: Crp/Fnr family transcriptional regulator [Lysobacterales bacterium]|jgi:CRP/FNR family transcriptional regulator|nr:MAG: Crp/Fnr family transcriptional regulator [Xanthomonadales bacterium]RPI17357.1 MAG: Crp/Fnr family transcriptional regulator [Xanthomonadales bacterium]